MNKFVLLLILAAIAFALYFNSFSNKFTYDDIPLIENNSNLKYFKSNIPNFFNLKYFEISKENTYRPIATLTYFIYFKLFKLNPLGYRIFNLFFHLLNGIFLFILLDKLFKNKAFSFLSCLFFLSHPILTEVLNCISFNEDILVTFFYLLSFILYLKYFKYNRQHKYLYFLSLFSLFLCLLSKEMGLTFLLVIILYDLFFNEQYGISKNDNLSISLSKVIVKNRFVYSGYMSVIILYLLLLFVIFKSPFVKNPLELSDNNLFQRIIYSPYFLFKYIKLIILPVNLNINHNFSYPENFFSLYNIFSYLTLFVIIIAAFYAYKYSKKIFFGICWFLITSIPILNIIKIYDPFAERFMYLPIIGFCIILGAIFTDLFDKIKNIKLKQSLKYFLIACLFIFYSYNTITRNFIWKDSISLWSDSIKKKPDNPRALINLAIEYSHQGSFDQSDYYLKKAIDISPNNSIAHYNLGENLTKKGNNEEAIKEYLKCINLNPNYYQAYNNLGLLYKDKGQIDDAIIFLKKATETNSKSFDSSAYYNLGNIYLSSEKYYDAIDNYKKVKKLDPENIKAIHNLGLCYYKLEDYNKALEELKFVITVSPDEINSYLLLVDIYIRQNILDEAKKYSYKIIEIAPNNSEAYFYLGMIYGLQNNYKEAILNWEKVLQFDPKNISAKENIEIAKKILK